MAIRWAHTASKLILCPDACAFKACTTTYLPRHVCTTVLGTWTAGYSLQCSVMQSGWQSTSNSCVCAAAASRLGVACQGRPHCEHLHACNVSELCRAGVASDAVKVAEYRSAMRLRSSMLQAGSWSGLEDETAYKNFSRILSKARPALSYSWRPHFALF